MKKEEEKEEWQEEEENGRGKEERRMDGRSRWTHYQLSCLLYRGRPFFLTEGRAFGARMRLTNDPPKYLRWVVAVVVVVVVPLLS